jgi:hypothetical protein
MDVARFSRTGFAFAVAVLLSLLSPGRLNAEALSVLAPAPEAALRAGEAAWAVELDRDLWRDAVERGSLAISLPDGGRLLLEDLRDVQSTPDLWIVAATVFGTNGRESAILTFGEGGVFAVLPTPSGLMEIRTDAGRSILRSAGGIRPPEGVMCAGGRCPPWVAGAVQRKSTGSTAPASDVAIPEMRGKRSAPRAMSKAQIEAAHALGPVTIDLLGLISSELALDATAEAAARTEFQHLVAVTNQAYADSGTNLVFNLVGIDKVRIDPAMSGRQSLDAITENNPLLEWDVHRRRNETSADLVALLRPFNARATECGLAWLGGFGLSPDSTDPAYGYSMTRTSPCGPYVLAHELGHNLGSHHDLANALDGQGELQRGAYLDSHGLRRVETPGFATVMAYEAGVARTIGRFSDPSRAECRGVACGIAGYSDNVASLRRMGPRVAAFRDSSSSMSIQIGDVREGESTADVPFVLRWPTAAPAEGRRFRVRLEAGTATAGQDFESYSVDGVLAPGEREWRGSWRVLGDATDEGDESLNLVVEGQGADAGRSARAALMVIDDDPKVRISGSVAFSGASPPAEGATLHWLYADAAGSKRFSMAVVGPAFDFGFDVPRGARVVLERTTVAAPFAGASVDLGMVTGPAQRTITLNSRVRLSGRLMFEGSQAPPSVPLWLDIHGAESPNSTSTFSVLPPDYAFEVDVRFGNSVDAKVRGLPSPWYDHQRFSLGAMRANLSRVFTLGLGVRVHGQVTFDPALPQPVPSAEVWINQYWKEPGGYSQIASPATLQNGQYSVSVRPEATVWVQGFARGISDSIDRFLGSPRTDTRADLHFSPAAEVVDSVAYTAIRRTTPPDLTHRIPVLLDRPVGSGGAYAMLEQVSGSARAGEDYRSSASLTAPPGSRYAFMEVTLKPADASAEPKSATFSIEPVVGLKATSKTLTVHIGKEEAATVLYSPGPRTLTEGDSGTRDLPIPLGLSKPAGPGGARATFGLWTRESRFNFPYATEGSDVSLPNPVLEFAPGQQHATLVLRIHGDTQPEYDEDFHIAVLRTEGIDGVAPATFDSGTFKILNDDAASFARPDRFDLLLEAAPARVDLPYRANDAELGETPWIGNGFSIVSSPRHGRVDVVSEQVGALTELRARYQPPARLPEGRDRFRYRSCGAYWLTPCAEADVDLRMLAFPAAAYELRVDRDRGHRDFERSGHPAIAGLRFETTPLAAPEVDRLALGFDPSPADAFDDEQGTVTRFAVVAPSAESSRWMLYARAATSASGDIDLYIGMDLNGNGRADSNEIVCTAAMARTVERCDHALEQRSGEGFAWWTRVHNRGMAQDVRLERYLIPLAGRPGFTLTSKAQVAQGAPWRWRVSWTLPGVASGESMAGAVRVKADDGLDLGWVPMRFERESGPDVAAPIAHAAHRSFAVPPGLSFNRAFVDVPPGIARLEVDVESSAPVNVRLVPMGAPAATSAAPLVRSVGNGAVGPSADGVQGRRVIAVDAPDSGQWFVQVWSPQGAAGTARVRITPRLLAAANTPRLQPGSYFNAARSGHGLFAYPAGPDWAGLWYTYLADGTPTWYYLQGRAPGAEGVWAATVFRSRWYGTANQLTAVGEATLTAGSDGTALFSHLIDGETGSEPLQSFGRGCPSISGRVVDASGHWFDPRRAGSGYSVQLFPNYEFYAVFGYDAQGEARYLAAELPRVGGPTERFPLVQLKGFCPQCPRDSAPTRRQVGFFEREFLDGRLSAIRLQADYLEGVPGRWTSEDAPIPLGTLQGCAAN